jgi:hypothetical protein
MTKTDVFEPIVCCSSSISETLGSSKAGERSWPMTCSFGNELGNQVKTLVAMRAAKRLVMPACVSDSWTIIGILRIYAAIQTGRATYHHLQKSLSILFFFNSFAATVIPAIHFRASWIFCRVDCRVQYLLNFPAGIAMNVTSGNLLADLDSIEFASPNRKSLQSRVISVSCNPYSISDVIGVICPHDHPQVNAMFILNSH